MKLPIDLDGMITRRLIDPNNLIKTKLLKVSNKCHFRMSNDVSKSTSLVYSDENQSLVIKYTGIKNIELTITMLSNENQIRFTYRKNAPFYGTYELCRHDLPFIKTEEAYFQHSTLKDISYITLESLLRLSACYDKIIEMYNLYNIGVK